MRLVTTGSDEWRTDDDGQRIIDRFTAEIFDADDENTPHVELEVHVVDGQPVVAAVTIRKQKGLVSRDIRVPVERYLQHVIQLPSVPGQHPHVPADLGRRRRRVLTDGFLRAVAEAYVAGGRSISGITPDVDPRFHASDSQKFRWIKAARERGILTDEED
jgi:hypothetical protein